MFHLKNCIKKGVLVMVLLNFALSLHYNGDNGYMFVNWK